MSDSLASSILTLMSIISFVSSIVALFVQVKDKRIIRVSRIQMAIILLAISIGSAGVSWFLGTRLQTDASESSTGTVSSPNTETHEPGTSLPLSSGTPAPEPSQEPAQESSQAPDSETAYEPVQPQLSFYINAYCDNDPLFTDYYILVSLPDTDYYIRYDYDDLPVKLEGAYGTYTVSVIDIWSDRLIEEHTLAITETIAEWNVFFRYQEQAEDTDQEYGQIFDLTEVTWSSAQFPDANLLVEILDGSVYSAYEVELSIGVEGDLPLPLCNCAEKGIWVEIEPFHEYIAYIEYQNDILLTQKFYVTEVPGHETYNAITIQLP